MSRKKILTLLVVLTLSLSLFVACSNDSGEGSSQNSTTDSNTNSDDDSSKETGNKTDVKRYTSAEKKVEVVGGELKKLDTPVFITSVGQSADVSMLDALMKKVGIEYTFNSTAKAADIADAKTIIICAGASSKGLGAAGISADDEKARATELLEACKTNGTTVIMAHLGGISRRGALSDEFSDMVMEYASYILMVEDANDDGKFSDFAASKNIPIIFVNTIADTLEPLKEMFN